MKSQNLLNTLKNFSLSLAFALIAVGMSAQNVYDDIISTSPDHTSLTAALNTAGLVSALQDPDATLTVFAPTNTAFDNLATALDTDIDGLLALPNLADILLYHVLGTTAQSGDITNGLIVTPLNDGNTIKLTLTSMGMVYANQSLVSTPDLNADNGVVHSVEAVLLPSETVVDVAIDNGFTSLTAAVVTAELLPALTDPLATLTVFAPSNMAFDNLATALGTDIDGLLALPNLAEILTYHVLGTTALSADLSNGDIVTPLNDANTIKLTVTAGGMVFANQAMVELPDLEVDNGVVHAIDAVILESETVVDVAIDNGFTTLATAVITAELLPALTDPLASYTVFAPTNEAFDQLAEDLGTDIDGILALPILADVLLYHVIGEELASGDLMAGPLATLAGVDVTVDVSSGVMINTATVTLADVGADNGVVHVINQVLLDETLSTRELDNNLIEIFPNPTSDFIVLRASEGDFTKMSLISMEGKIVLQQQVFGLETRLDVQGVAPGIYMVKVEGETSAAVKRLVIN